ncbi:Lrp/AsnC family transcriptional regulator [Microbacterium soli]|uniref:Lrp/AsnC family transcriptional regulator n=1 Tax=Microbacterium soli TaxID=446075 RepID=A0ABP7NBS0_9MICO
MSAIDGLDARIIALLTQDARVGVVELARRLGVSRNTVQSRMRWLEEHQVIRGYRPWVDLESVGLHVQAFIALKLVQGRLRTVAAELARLPEVLEMHVTTGEKDLLLRVATTNHAMLQQLLERVYSVPGVSDSSTSLSMTTPLHFRLSPLLDTITEGAGFGRAKPSAAEGGSVRPDSGPPVAGFAGHARQESLDARTTSRGS